MQTKTTIENQLRAEILAALRRVDAENCPNIWKRIQTRTGYAQVEEMIINMVINDHITPSACIPQLESEML